MKSTLNFIVAQTETGAPPVTPLPGTAPTPSAPPAPAPAPAPAPVMNQGTSAAPALVAGTLTNTGTGTVQDANKPVPQMRNPLWPPDPMLILIVGMGVMFWWMSRQQKKQRAERQKLLDAVKSGDRVVTTGGIHGVVANTKDKTLIVKIADNVKIEINRSAVEVVEARNGEETAAK